MSAADMQDSPAPTPDDPKCIACGLGFAPGEDALATADGPHHLYPCKALSPAPTPSARRAEADALREVRNDLAGMLETRPPSRRPYLQGFYGVDVVGRAVRAIDAILALDPSAHHRYADRVLAHAATVQCLSETLGEDSDPDCECYGCAGRKYVALRAETPPLASREPVSEDTARTEQRIFICESCYEHYCGHRDDMPDECEEGCGTPYIKYVRAAGEPPHHSEVARAARTPSQEPKT